MGKINGNLQIHDQIYRPIISNEIQPKPTKSMMNNKKKKKPLKVTYISNPVKVTATNASEFLAIVQELTGKDSEVGQMSPRYEDGRPTGSMDSGAPWNPPADYPSSSTVTNSRSPTPEYDGRRYNYAEEALDFPSEPMAVHGFGFDESLLWREPDEAFLGFQSSHCVSTWYQ